MRKRSEAAPGQQSMVPAQEAEKPKVSESPKLPIEGDLSAMYIELKKRGFVLVRLSDVSGWLPQVRHVVAMYLSGQLSEEDVPEAVKSFRGEHEDAQPYAAVVKEVAEAAKAQNKLRASVNIQDLGESLPFVENLASKKCETIELVAGELLAPPDTITVTWGAEKFYPSAKGYNNFEVGMVSTTLHLKPGQDKLGAAREAYGLLEKLGEEFRERKRVNFLRALKGVLEDPKEK